MRTGEKVPMDEVIRRIRVLKGDKFPAAHVCARAVGEIGFASHGWRIAEKAWRIAEKAKMGVEIIPGLLESIRKVTVITSEHYDKKHVPHRKISDADVANFNAQYPKLAVRYNESFRDRFLIIDDKGLYLIGASLKDLGQKCFAFTKLDAGEIRRIKKTAFGRGESE